MTREQEQAASAARRACIAYLTSTTDKRDTISAYWGELRLYKGSLAAVTRALHESAIDKAWTAAWHTQMEAR